MLVLALAGCAGTATPPTPVRVAPASTDWSRAATVAVTLSDFEYDPGKITLTAYAPVKLVLTNHGSGRHDFSAPEFFATTTIGGGASQPVKGDVTVEKGQSAEIDLVPGAVGHFDLTCTEFLHSAFGMNGSIDVVAPTAP